MIKKKHHKIESRIPDSVITSCVTSSDEIMHKPALRIEKNLDFGQEN